MDLQRHENAQRMVAVVNTAMSRGPVNPVEFGKPEEFRKVRASDRSSCFRYCDSAERRIIHVWRGRCDHGGMDCSRSWIGTLSDPRFSSASGYLRYLTTRVSKCIIA